VLPKFDGHVAACKQCPQLQIPQECVIGEIGAREKCLVINNGSLGMQLAWFAEYVKFSVFKGPIGRSSVTHLRLPAMRFSLAGIDVDNLARR